MDLMQIFFPKKVSALLGVMILMSLLGSGCAVTDTVDKKASYHYQMGLSYLGESNITKALIEFAEAEKISPEDADILNQLGVAYYYKKKYDLAEEKYLKAIRLKPNFPEARNNLGVVYLDTKRWDDAINQFKMVTEDIFYQNQEGALINLGLAHLGKEDFPRAISIFNSLVMSNPKNPVVRLNLGRAYFAMGKTDLAIAEYQNALQFYREYASAYYHLGLAYIRLKDKEAARTAFNEVIRIAPYTELSQMALDRLESLK